MILELKNFKYAEFSSEETHCFQATVYVDGVRAFIASNDGHGGCDSYYHVNKKGAELLKSALEWAKNLPPIKFSGGGTLPNNLECVIGELVTNKLVERDLKKMFKSKTLFIKPNEGDVLSLKQVFSDAVKNSLIKKIGDEVIILNDLDMPLAIELFRDPTATHLLPDEGVRLK